jgi:hypothetical protein
LGFAPTIPGFSIKSIANKAADGSWVKQVKSPGEQFQVPEGHEIRGVSAYVDADGREIAKWIKTHEGAASAKLLADVVRASFNDFVSRYEPVAAPTVCNESLLTQYVVGDHHLGLLAWKPEAGESYDLKIGERLLRDKMAELVARTPDSETAIFLNLGDFFHSNNTRNQTEKSGNHLSVDGRYGKVLQVGIKLAVACIEMLLAKHKQVVVWWLLGNHDPEVALSAMLALWAWFRDEPRIEIEFNPSKFCVLQHGETMLAATHGDTLRPAQAAGFAAAKWPKIWGSTTSRYMQFGHVHHSSKQDPTGGLTWETFESLAGKDDWHAAHGFLGKRSMTAITYHDKTGEFSRNRVSV